MSDTPILRRIAIVAHSLYPIAEPYAGGLEMITHGLVDTLVARDYQVDLYAHPDSQTKAQLIPFASLTEMLAQAGYAQAQAQYAQDIVGYISPDMHEHHQQWLYHRAMQQVARAGYDLVHNHALHYLPIVYGEMLGTHYLTTFHTPAFAHLSYAMQLLVQPPRQHFSVVSHKQRALWQGYSDSLHTVYNGIFVERWRYRLEPDPDNYLMWFGRICPEKGTHHAIEACVQTGRTLYLAGPDSNPDYMASQVTPYLSHPNIHYLGHLEHQAPNAYLAGAQAMLFTSTWDEPYGLTIAEALASGCPVLAFPVGAAAEIVTERCGYLCKDVSTVALIEGLAHIPKLSRAACRQRAEDFCSIERMVDSYLALYHHIVQPNTKALQ